MKRIKLFEAFNITNKIEKVNSSVFCWCFESFIKEKIQDGSFEFMCVAKQLIVNQDIVNLPERFIVSDTDSGNYLLIYDFDLNVVTRYNMPKVYYSAYFISRKLDPPNLYVDRRDEVLFVLKKLYQDEKNKTI